MSTLRLYEIADTYLRALEDPADIEDLPEQAIADTLEGLQGEFEEKAISTGAYVRNLEAEAAAIEEARKSMERRQRSLTRHADRLRQYLKAQIERTGMGKIKNCYLTLRIQNNPPSVVVENEGLVPEQFKRTETVTNLLRAEIARALKDGQLVEGARLQRSTRLVIQ
ncbi:MAG: siphovirus Gp157 family protein [Acidobacteria bacterium]|nr:siphovirus Gp157 family protein [Acidobacteriota bacterium]